MKQLATPLRMPSVDSIPELPRERRHREIKESNTERREYRTREDTLWQVQAQLRQQFQTQPLMIPAIIKPNDDDWLLKITMQAPAPKDTAETNTACNNHKHQVTNMVIDEVLGNLLEYQHLIKPPNVKIWELALANDLGRPVKGYGSRITKGTNTIFSSTHELYQMNEKWYT